MYIYIYILFYILFYYGLSQDIDYSQYYIVSTILCYRRRQWHPTPVLLPGKSHGWRSLVGCSPWGCEESDTTERLHFHFSLSRIGEGNGNPLQCSCLENPRDGGAWWAAVYGVTQSRTQLKRLSSSSSSILCYVVGPCFLIHSMYNGLHLLIPISQSIPFLPPTPHINLLMYFIFLDFLKVELLGKRFFRFKRKLLTYINKLLPIKVMSIYTPTSTQ